MFTTPGSAAAISVDKSTVDCRPCACPASSATIKTINNRVQRRWRDPLTEPLTHSRCAVCPVIPNALYARPRAVKLRPISPTDTHIHFNRILQRNRAEYGVYPAPRTLALLAVAVGELLLSPTVAAAGLGKRRLLPTVTAAGLAPAASRRYHPRTRQASAGSRHCRHQLRRASDGSRAGTDAYLPQIQPSAQQPALPSRQRHLASNSFEQSSPTLSCSFVGDIPQHLQAEYCLPRLFTLIWIKIKSHWNFACSLLAAVVPSGFTPNRNSPNSFARVRWGSDFGAA